MHMRGAPWLYPWLQVRDAEESLLGYEEGWFQGLLTLGVFVPTDEARYLLEGANPGSGLGRFDWHAGSQRAAFSGVQCHYPWIDLRYSKRY